MQLATSRPHIFLSISDLRVFIGSHNEPRVIRSGRKAYTWIHARTCSMSQTVQRLQKQRFTLLLMSTRRLRVYVYA